MARHLHIASESGACKTMLPSTQPSSPEQTWGLEGVKGRPWADIEDDEPSTSGSCGGSTRGDDEADSTYADGPTGASSVNDGRTLLRVSSQTYQQGDDEADSVSAHGSPSSTSGVNDGRTRLRISSQTYQPKTSLMIRNIACSYTRKAVEQVLAAAGLWGTYDYLYVPMNPPKTSNLGYCFVNFTTWEDAQWCYWTFHGYPFGDTGSLKICEVSWADVQRGCKG